MFRSLADILGVKESRGPKAQDRIREAYAKLLGGNPTKQDIELVLVDLAKTSGYYNTTPPEASDAALRYAEGQRSVFARVLQMANPAFSEIDAIRKAVSEETLTDQQTGHELQ